MTNALKPVRCGCGGEAKVDWTVINGAYMAGVVCQKCGTKTTSFYDRDDKDKVIAEAITAWNRAMGGVVTYPSTTPNGVHTSGCTTTNTTDPNEDFHPVRDFMVKPERTAKVFQSIDGYRCDKCFYRFETTAIPQYCPKCGSRLEWK